MLPTTLLPPSPHPLPFPFGTCRRGVKSGFWRVKNSWGADWGDSGYIQIALEGGPGEKGICGINMQPSAPLGASMARNYTPPTICGALAATATTAAAAASDAAGPLAAAPEEPAPAEPAVCASGSSCCCAKKGFLGVCKAWDCCSPGQTCKKGQGCSSHASP